MKTKMTFKSVLESSTWGSEQAADFLKAYDLECLTSPLEDCHFLKQHIETAVERSREISFDQDFGFCPIEAEQVCRYFESRNEYALKLNKEKGKHLLYGLDHIRNRQHFFNALPASWRLTIGLPKLKRFHIKNHLAGMMDIQVTDSPNIKITDMFDIGMSHSIYRITICLNDLCKTFVVKEELLPHQAFHCHILKECGYHTFNTTHVFDVQGSWDISEYVGKNHLDFYCHRVKEINWDIVTQLGKHAALGDCMGRGDRHFENYMLSGDQLVPIDVSYLFSEGNEEWTDIYLKGGMYEFNICLEWEKYAPREKIIACFFESYDNELKRLNSIKFKIIDQINLHYWEHDPETSRKVDFFKSRVEDPAYGPAMKQRYLNSLDTTIKRREYKLKLEKAVKKNPKILAQNPLLKMYYYANKNRMTAFFLVEHHDETHIFDMIESL